VCVLRNVQGYLQESFEMQDANMQVEYIAMTDGGEYDDGCELGEAGRGVDDGSRKNYFPVGDKRALDALADRP